MTGEVLGIINLINQGVRIPRELAQALLNACLSITGGILEIKNSIAMYGRERNTVSSSSKPSLPLPDNEKNILACFLSLDTYSLSGSLEGSGSSDGSGNPGGSDSPGSSGGSDNPDSPGGSGGADNPDSPGGSDNPDGPDSSGGSVSPSRQEATKTAVENLYRTTAFLTSARIISNMNSLTYKKAEGYWRLLKKLEESINRENPAVYAAIQDVHTALSRELSRRELSREMIRSVSNASPLLYLAYYLGCDEDKIRELNAIADSFVIEGDIIYV
jgi:hypothetical protein